MQKICTTAFLIQGSRVLLGLKKRGTAQGKWNGFGGKQEAGETVVETMLRELKEESGVEATAYNQVGVLDFGNDVLAYIYIVTSWIGNPMETEEMIPKWFDMNDVPYDNMWPDDKEWLPRILRGEKIKGSFVLDNNKLIEFNIETLP